MIEHDKKTNKTKILIKMTEFKINFLKLYKKREKILEERNKIEDQMKKLQKKAEKNHKKYEKLYKTFKKHKNNFIKFTNSTEFTNVFGPDSPYQVLKQNKVFENSINIKDKNIKLKK